jgi:uncharacterized protein YbjQ (UPF0145 family)
MNKCVDCSAILTVYNSMPNQRCAKCHGRFLSSTINHERLKEQGLASLRPEDMSPQDRQEYDRQFFKKRASIEQNISKVMLTTETAPNLNITKRIEIVTAECAFGMNIFKDLFAGIRDIVGGRSEAVQKTLRDSRKTALYELKKEAHAVGANAVVGVDLDYVELSAAGNMVLLVASGTAVVIEE